MLKLAVIILADTDTHEALGRVVNALETAKELKLAGDDVQIVFDGAGTKWVPELAKADHKAHALYASVRDKVSAVCGFCAGAFGATKGVEAAGLPLVREFEGHPSLRKLLVSGYQLVTF